MKEKPILFSGPMVRAILDGRKTQTRRVIKPAPLLGRDGFGPYMKIGKLCGAWPGDAKWIAHTACPIGKPGDRLWVRETWQTHCDKDHITPRDLPPDTAVQYPATYNHWVSKRRPGIHMPRWASRITLKVTDVRVQRLQDISEEDAIAEGIRLMRDGGGVYVSREGPGNLVTPWPTATEAFSDLWNGINGPDSWDANPWVYALTFEVEKAQNSVAGLKRPKADERPLPAEGAA